MKSLLLVAVVVPLVACTSAPSEPSRMTTSKLEDGWAALGNGQCLVAMQSFYRNAFGVALPIARNAWTGSCGPEGACHLWVDDVPSSSDWERIPNDGTRSPVKYDLVVYPPSGKNIWGHVASVDHVGEDGAIWVMDSNWHGDEQRSSAPHTTPGYTAYGWYHLRTLGAASASEPDDVRSDVSCGQLAEERDWGDRALCEWNGNEACGGHGTVTWDCDHCCVR